MGAWPGRSLNNYESSDYLGTVLGRSEDKEENLGEWRTQKITKNNLGNSTMVISDRRKQTYGNVMNAKKY